jgi:hypothetical protein
LPGIERLDAAPPRHDTPQEIQERHERQRAHIELQALLNAEELERERLSMSRNGRPGLVRN